MIRKLNFTGRKKINKSSVNIEIVSENDQRFFNAEIDLAEFDLPGNAHVYVEAYHRSGYRRYNFGTIADRHKPRDRSLSGFLETAIPLFRVKVVDKSNRIGKILAAADKIRPRKVNGKALDEKSLLWIVYEDIGESAWILDLEGDWPELRLNNKLPDVTQLAVNDPRFLLLVYPEIFRQVLKRIVLIDKQFETSIEDDWHSEWLKMAFSLPTFDKISEEDTQADIERWIDQAVDAFCKKNRFLETFIRVSGGDTDK